jgi:hypothetical protein
MDRTVREHAPWKHSMNGGTPGGRTAFCSSEGYQVHKAISVKALEDTVIVLLGEDLPDDGQEGGWSFQS